MKGICTKVSDAEIQTYLGNIAIDDDDDLALMDKLIEVTTRFRKAPLAKLWVWMDLPADVDDASGIQVVAMSATDYIFLQNLQNTTMMISKQFTPSSTIRMTITDSIVRVWWVDPKKQQNATPIAVFDNGTWILTSEHHRWLWTCVTMSLSDWLRESYHTLTKATTHEPNR